MLEIRRYSEADKSVWNAFVAQSKNGTFLFDRRYMDYHSDRFSDFSLMIYRKGRLFALLPANRVGYTLYSHQGLTYGGMITAHRATAPTVCEAFVAVNQLLRESGISRVVYKAVPHIYHREPAEEDLYALSLRCGASLTRRQVSSALRLDRPPSFDESRRSGLRKALHLGLTVSQSDDVAAFWQILTENLRSKYSSSPVHSVAEMQLLMSHFPQQIKLYMVFTPDHIPVGGTVLYLTPQVIHTQYISASAEGKQAGAIDLLFDEIIHQQPHTQTYLDIGTSSQPDSCEVNGSLLFQKLGFGARAVCYDTYEWPLH